MSDIRKAAVLLLSLPEEEARLMLRKLGGRQLQAVITEIARLGHVSANEQMQTVRAFADAGPDAVAGTCGGFETAKSLVDRSLGRAAADLLDNVQQSLGQVPFAFLRQIDPQNLLTFLDDEHPQTIALILSFLPPSYAAVVLAGLGPERRLPVVERIAGMGRTSDDVIDEVQSNLARRMAGTEGLTFQQAGGVVRAAEILGVVDHSIERAILQHLAEQDPDLADRIRQNMFAFDDIARLSDKDIQTLLKNVETAQWAVALKGVSEELKQRILSNMSKRAAGLLLEEMQYKGPVLISEVEQVRRQILEIIRALEENDLISLSFGAAEEEYVA